MRIVQEQEVVVEKVFEEEKKDGADNNLTNPQWSVIIVTNLDIFNGSVHVMRQEQILQKLKKRCC